MKSVKKRRKENYWCDAMNQCNENPLTHDEYEMHAMSNAESASYVAMA